MRMIEHNGLKLCLTTWADRLGYRVPTLRARLKRLPFDEAMQPGKHSRREGIVSLSKLNWGGVNGCQR